MLSQFGCRDLAAELGVSCVQAYKMDATTALLPTSSAHAGWHDSLRAVPCCAMLCLQNYQVDATTTLLYTEDASACYTPLCHDVHTVS